MDKTNWSLKGKAMTTKCKNAKMQKWKKKKKKKKKKERKARSIKKKKKRKNAKADLWIQIKKNCEAFFLRNVNKITNIFNWNLTIVKDTSFQK